MRILFASLFALAVVSTPAIAREARQPALKSQAALVVDQDSGEILLGKNAESKLPIASLTKLMTAIVTLDADLDPDEPVTITKADVDRLRGSHSRLQVGTTLTRDEMLHLALMASENRAASAIANSYPGGQRLVRARDESQGAASGNVGHALRGRHRAVRATTCRRRRTSPSWSRPRTPIPRSGTSRPRPRTR